jgi:hypothetical protein
MRFLVFAFDSYYPRGGWDDFQQSFKSLKEAKLNAESLAKNTGENIQIVDLETKEVFYKCMHGGMWSDWCASEATAHKTVEQAWAEQNLDKLNPVYRQEVIARMKAKNK